MTTFYSTDMDFFSISLVVFASLLALFCGTMAVYHGYHYHRWKALERLPEVSWLIQEGFVRVWAENERWSEKQDCVVYDVKFDDSNSPWKLIQYSSADGYAVLAHKREGYKPMKVRKSLLEKVGGI